MKICRRNGKRSSADGAMTTTARHSPIVGVLLWWKIMLIIINFVVCYSSVMIASAEMNTFVAFFVCIRNIARETFRRVLLWRAFRSHNLLDFPYQAKIIITNNFILYFSSSSSGDSWSSFLLPIVDQLKREEFFGELWSRSVASLSLEFEYKSLCSCLLFFRQTKARSACWHVIASVEN